VNLENNMSFTNIKHILPSSLKRHGIKNQVDEKMIIAKFDEVKDTLFEKREADQIKAVYVKWGTLSVACLSDSVVELLKAREHDILDIINKELGYKLVKGLYYLT
jgi:predicted nucleic acid-binding Zn ribbon protein